MRAGQFRTEACNIVDHRKVHRNLSLTRPLVSGRFVARGHHNEHFVGSAAMSVSPYVLKCGLSLN
jgi:hypothetical protein